jgi:predicted histidine transporter YuiF (NhaC family)
MLYLLGGIAVMIAAALVCIIIKQRKISMDVQTILDKVTAEKTVVDSAVALLGSLSQAIKDAGTDQTKLQAISDALDGQSSELAAAVAANTPTPPAATA